VSGNHWWGKGGGRAPGRATLDTWAAWVAQHILKRSPQDPRGARVDIYKHLEVEDEAGRFWTVFVRLKATIVWFRRGKPELKGALEEKKGPIVHPDTES